MDEEREAMQSPSFKINQQLSENEQDFSPPRTSTINNSTMITLIPPQSPNSPWTLSPIHTPTRPLLYHCIASLRRHDGSIYSIAISRGVVFTGSESRRIRAWRQPDCIERGYIKSSSGEVRAILAYGSVTTIPALTLVEYYGYQFNQKNKRKQKELQNELQNDS